MTNPNSTAIASVVIGLAEWADQITITGSGTFALKVTLESMVSANAIFISSPQTPGGGEYFNRARLTVPGVAGVFSTMVLTDQLDDGDMSLQIQTATNMLTLDSGSVFRIISRLEISSRGWSSEGVSATHAVDAMNTASFTLSPITPGAAYTTASSATYVPEPSTGILLILGGALAVLVRSRHGNRMAPRG